MNLTSKDRKKDIRSRSVCDAEFADCFKHREVPLGRSQPYDAALDEPGLARFGCNTSSDWPGISMFPDVWRMQR